MELIEHNKKFLFILYVKKFLIILYVKKFFNEY